MYKLVILFFLVGCGFPSINDVDMQTQLLASKLLQMEAESQKSAKEMAKHHAALESQHIVLSKKLDAIGALIYEMYQEGKEIDTRGGKLRGHPGN